MLEQIHSTRMNASTVSSAQLSIWSIGTYRLQLGCIKQTILISSLQLQRHKPTENDNGNSFAPSTYTAKAHGTVHAVGTAVNIHTATCVQNEGYVSSTVAHVPCHPSRSLHWAVHAGRYTLPQDLPWPAAGKMKKHVDTGQGEQQVDSGYPASNKHATGDGDSERRQHQNAVRGIREAYT